MSRSLVTTKLNSKYTAGGSGGTGTTYTIGTLNNQTKSANGLVITGSSIYAQTADNNYPGLVSTGAQTFAGLKTFKEGIAYSTALNSNIVSKKIFLKANSRTYLASKTIPFTTDGNTPNSSNIVIPVDLLSTSTTRAVIASASYKILYKVTAISGVVTFSGVTFTINTPHVGYVSITGNVSGATEYNNQNFYVVSSGLYGGNPAGNANTMTSLLNSSNPPTFTASAPGNIYDTRSFGLFFAGFTSAFTGGGDLTIEGIAEIDLLYNSIS